MSRMHLFAFEKYPPDTSSSSYRLSGVIPDGELPAIDQPAHEPRSHPATLFRQALQLIDRQLQEEDLRPERLAEQLHLSRRRLYQVFEAQGETVSRCIQKRRLAKIAQDLASQRLEHQSITQIAFKWGFSDAAHFSRAFRRQFDLSPRAFRARASNHATAGTLPGAHGSQ